MYHLISLTGENTLDLDAKRYRVDVVGGWGVKLNGFSLRLINVATNKVVTCRKAVWPAQTYFGNKRKKRMLTFTILDSGSYHVEIENPGSIKVRPSNLFMNSFFERPIQNSEVRLYIY